MDRAKSIPGLPGASRPPPALDAGASGARPLELPRSLAHATQSRTAHRHRPVGRQEPAPRWWGINE